MAIRFPRDLARLTAECAERFADRPTHAYVVRDILDHLEHGIFADEQGVPQTTAIAVNRGLAAAFDAVLAAHDPDAVHTATLTEFFLAYVYSNTDNIQANLHYLDYKRLKDGGAP